MVVKHIKKKVYSGKDKELDHSDAKYSIQDNPATSGNPSEQNGPVSTPTSLSPEEPGQYEERRSTSASRRGTAAKLPRPNVKPPPPPPVQSQILNTPSPQQPPPNFPPPGSPVYVPPPPPPPPDPNIPAPPPPLLPIIGSNHIQPPSEPAMPAAPKPVDTRTDILDAIKQGMKLRKVQVESEKKQQQAVGMDVASILQRRIAVEYSDTESETGSEWDEDDEEWDEGED